MNQVFETKQKILEVAAQLYMEKGFNQTSMQDICDALNISKGAVYHHFRSKEEIIQGVMEMQSEKTKEIVEQWIGDIKAHTAKEKLTKIIEKDVHDREGHELDEVFSTQMKSSDFIVSTMRDAVEKAAPIIASIMKEGVEDKSISTDYPEELSEVFLLLFNIWCDPVIFECNEDKLMKRLQFLQVMMKQLGADIITNDSIDSAKKVLDELYQKGD